MRRANSSIALLMIMGLTSLCALALTPRVMTARTGLDIETLVPKAFGDWVAKDTPVSLVSLQTTDDPTEKVGRLYDQVLMRTYANSAGDEVMLAIAYRREQNEELRIHRPELCYYAQGFSVKSLGEKSLKLSSVTSVRALRLFAQSPARREPVLYWIRIDNRIVVNAWQIRWTILKEGLRGNIGDGVLVRISSLVKSDSELHGAFNQQQGFISSLYQSLSTDGQKLLVGS